MLHQMQRRTSRLHRRRSRLQSESSHSRISETPSRFDCLRFVSEGPSGATVMRSAWQSILAASEEVLYFGKCGNAPPGADLHAFHCGDGVGKPDRLFQTPVLK